LIHEISGLNIIIDPNVTGAVTVVLDSVPWDQALDIVLKNNRLGKVLEGNVLRIAQGGNSDGGAGRANKASRRPHGRGPAGNGFPAHQLRQGQDIATLLKTWAGGGALSRRGTVLVDARSNTLIISDVQTQIPIIENIVPRLIRKRSKFPSKREWCWLMPTSPAP
jgi:type IV pilus assembly protein PilQ